MNNRYTFRCDVSDDYGHQVEQITHVNMGGDVTWEELCISFQNFLTGCGFVLPAGELEIVDYSIDDSEKSIEEE